MVISSKFYYVVQVNGFYGKSITLFMQLESSLLQFRHFVEQVPNEVLSEAKLEWQVGGGLCAIKCL